MSGALARWWSSIAFRQALIFGALVVFTMTVLLAVFYVQTVGVWQRRIDSQIAGWGLGLASVLAIAKLHGGSLQLEDAGPGLIARLVLPATA